MVYAFSFHFVYIVQFCLKKKKENLRGTVMAFSARRKIQSFFLPLFDYQEREREREKERKVLECDNLFLDVKEIFLKVFLLPARYS